MVLEPGIGPGQVDPSRRLLLYSPVKFKGAWPGPEQPDARFLNDDLSKENNPVRQLLLAAFAGASLVLSVGANAAGDAAAGKSKSAVCAACHGATGTSPNAMWPNLAGQKEAYLLKQLKAFKSGARKDPMMTPMASPLSDQDMANLAAYYSSQKPK
jgi:cytochrome c553